MHREHFLDYDDEGQLAGGMSIKPVWQPVETLHEVLLKLIPDKAGGGYQGFIDQYHLQGVVTAGQLETLFTESGYCAGKNLMGVLSVLVPPEVSSWRKIRNIWEREHSGRHVLDIGEEQQRLFAERVIAAGEWEFRHVLRFSRRIRFVTQKILAEHCDIVENTVGEYEAAERHPDMHMVHRIGDVLNVAGDVRHAMLASLPPDAGNGDPGEWRRELERFAGGRSLFGAMLTHVCHERQMTQRDLAIKCGNMCEGSLSQYKRSACNPETIMVHRLCDALEVKPQVRWLMLAHASPAARGQLESDDEKSWRRGLAAFAGGGSVFGALLYHLRCDRAMTQKTLAEACGITRHLILAYEAGANVPNLIVTHRICDALGVDSDVRRIMIGAAAGDRAQGLESNDEALRKRGLAAFIGGGSLFGAMLYHLCDERGMTQKELAGACGVSEREISRYRTGKDYPDAAMVYRICAALDASDNVRKLMLKSIEHSQRR